MLSDERTKHLEWCKQRALQYVEGGDLASAVASMGSDLSKHPETKHALHNDLALIGMWYAAKHDAEAVKRWIEGFN